MILKLFLLLVVPPARVTMLLRQSQARRTGWIITGSLVLIGLLVIQVLRTLDTIWR